MAHQPVIEAEGTIIIEAFVRALRERPSDFAFEEKPWQTDEHFFLIDRRTGHEWWIANEDYGFHLYRPKLCFGYWARRKAWRAFKAWSRDVGQGEKAREVFLALDDANAEARAA